MNLTISKYHPKRTAIENMVKRINLATADINHTVWVVESKPDLLNRMNQEKEIVEDMNRQIDEEKTAIKKLKAEIDTYEARLKLCGIFDRHIKRYFKKEIDKLMAKIRAREDKIIKLQNKFNAHYSNFYKYRKHLPTPQDLDKAVSDHKKLVSYVYNPQIRLLGMMTGCNFETADPEEFISLTPIQLSTFEANGIYANSVHQVSIDQSKSQEEME